MFGHNLIINGRHGDKGTKTFMLFVICVKNDTLLMFNSYVTHRHKYTTFCRLRF
jgi:hypothetical protein